jgi:cysteinyl-tRNA synthetase
MKLDVAKTTVRVLEAAVRQLTSACDRQTEALGVAVLEYQAAFRAQHGSTSNNTTALEHLEGVVHSVREALQRTKLDRDQAASELEKAQTVLADATEAMKKHVGRVLVFPE